MKEVKKTQNYFVPFIVVGLLFIAAIAYIGVDKFVLSRDKEKCDTEVVEDEEDEFSTNQEAGSIKCSGIYSGDYTENGYDLHYTYNLNKDGTFSASFSETTGTIGAFVITDNTVSFISRKESTGDREVEPIYDTVDYVMAEDCSYILVNDGTVSFKLNKN